MSSSPKQHASVDFRATVLSVAYTKASRNSSGNVLGSRVVAKSCSARSPNSTTLKTLHQTLRLVCHRRSPRAQPHPPPTKSLPTAEPANINLISSSALKLALLDRYSSGSGVRSKPNTFEHTATNESPAGESKVEVFAARRLGASVKKYSNSGRESCFGQLAP